jgi:hypothetical protein
MLSKENTNKERTASTLKEIAVKIFNFYASGLPNHPMMIRRSIYLKLVV